MRKTLATLLSLVMFAVAALAQAPDKTVSWNVSAQKAEDGLYTLTFSGSIEDGWHVYDTHNEMSPTAVEFTDISGYVLEGSLEELTQCVDFEGDDVFFKKVRLAQKLRLTGADTISVHGVVTWQACTDQFCAMPEEWEFEVKLVNDKPATTVSEASVSSESTGSLWALIIEAVLWGFAMLLTPCVFPMIPMTISFFMKGSSSASAGRFKAFMYGLFIVLLYTVPISIIIGITWLVGGDAVTADIFNWLATHWLPNIIFFLVFMIFAASFFGAFEITLPSSLVNKSDRNSDKKGLAGIFFMALTLVLVSFSCTGPIVGSVLIKSTQGEFWTPMVTMLAFSIAFALPFTIFALFPSLLTKLKSGSWLNSVKVVLGFIEIAFGFKFLSVADQTYHWGLLDREVYLAIWIVVFSLLGLYLLGKIKFKNDDDVPHLGVFRLFLVIVDFAFVVYMIPGMWGAPLKALSGYLPPLYTQDFILGQGATGNTVLIHATTEENVMDLHLPLGLTGYFTLNEGLEAAKESGKPIFVDITGHGCVNCREMEQRVWSDPKVLQLLRDEFVIVALYTDDKTKMPESDWVTADNGTVLKDMGRINSYYVRKRFGVNAQPNYVILSPEGEQLTPVRGYGLDIDEYVAFLRSGLK